MARRGNKIEPSVLTFALETKTLPAATQLTPGGTILPTTTTLYCDYSQLASLYNRRFYRQGLNWATAGFKMISTLNNPTGSGSVDAYVAVSKLPNTWVMSNAWEKSMKTWLRQIREALEENESIRPRFLDFKIYADEAHHSAGYGDNWLPANANEGEWESAKIFYPNTATAGAVGNVETEMIAVGANYPGAGASGLDAVSLIEGYAASRGLPDIVSPNTPDDAERADGSQPQNWMTAMFNDGTDQFAEVIEVLTEENNSSPYPFENGPNPAGGDYTDTQYPGGANQLAYMEIHDQHPITSTTLGGTTRLKGGNFPCGLVKFQLFNYTLEAVDVALLIDMVPGDHRGYLCEPMTEM